MRAGGGGGVEGEVGDRLEGWGCGGGSETIGVRGWGLWGDKLSVRLI